MPLATEPDASGKPAKSARFVTGLARWNRKLHFYAGLFLLFFMWLFALSGLILNHPAWEFSESWKNRRQADEEIEMAAPGPEAKGDLAQAREIMRQLGITGEILWTTTRANPDQFEFQVRRPGRYFFVKADFARKRVALRRNDVNLWGVMKVLHTFTGVQLDDDRNTRDWALTTLWVFSMDVVAVGLIVMVLSSLYMTYERRSKRLPGAIALGLGILCCGLFCAGLRWLF